MLSITQLIVMKETDSGSYLGFWRTAWTFHDGNRNFALDADLH